MSDAPDLGSTDFAGGAEPAPSSGPEPALTRAEEQVFFQGDGLLEGRLGWPEDPEFPGGPVPEWILRGGVVVAHPYPPNGANMDLPLIYHVAKSCRGEGFASLRFNFRGVGESAGTFSGTEEDRDVAAAVSFMRDRLDPTGGAGEFGLPVGLAGWSFGSVMAARAAAGLSDVKALALVGFAPLWEQLPEDTIERLGRYRGPVLAVCAENDHISSPWDVERVLGGLDLEFELTVIPDADHYLQGRHREVSELVAGFFGKVLVP
jgi:alpha/beta superfamily hydrolase